MGKPRIKINVFKQVKNVYRRLCKILWKFQFGPEFSEPNQGAICENCLLFKIGECWDHIPPEMCIEQNALAMIKDRIEPKFLKLLNAK